MSVDEVKGANMANKKPEGARGGYVSGNSRFVPEYRGTEVVMPAPKYSEPTTTESIFVCEVCQKPAIAGVVDYRRYHEDGVLKYGELATHFFCAEHKRDAVYTDG